MDQDDVPVAPLRVLAIEDTAGISPAIEAALTRAGMIVATAPTGSAGLARHRTFGPDVVLIDLGLPDMSGLDLIRRFAKTKSGIIVITADGKEASRVRCLNTGADDYQVKPVALGELVARIRAVSRRLRGATPAPSATGSIRIDTARRLLHGSDAEPSELTEAEYLIHAALLAAAGSAVARGDLSAVALRRPLNPDDRSIDQLVLKLRRKLADQGAPPRTILAVRRQGYLIAEPDLFG